MKSVRFFLAALLLAGIQPALADEVLTDPAGAPICTVQRIVKGDGAIIAGTVDRHGDIIDNKGCIVGYLSPDAVFGNGTVIQGCVQGPGNIMNPYGHVVGHSLKVVALGVGSTACGTLDVNGDLISDDGAIIGHVLPCIKRDLGGMRVLGTVNDRGNIVNGNGDIIANVVGYPFVLTAKTALRPVTEVASTTTTTTLTKETAATPYAVSEVTTSKTVVGAPAAFVLAQGDPTLGFQSHQLALKIDDALASGQITSNDANRLRKRLLDIDNLEATLAVDGTIDNKAARRIAFEYDRMYADMDADIASR